MIRHKLLLSLDIGTTSLKVGLFTSLGDLIRVGAREQEILFPALGRAEQSAHDTWRLIGEAVREVTHDEDRSSIGAIALSIQRGTVVALGLDHEPIGNQIVWMDNRGLPQVEWLKEHVGLPVYYDTSGHGLTHITGVSKLLWYRQNDAALWNSLSVVAPPQTLFLKWLGCRDLVCDLSCGTYLFPFNIDEKRWSRELADKLDYPLNKLPTLVTATEVVGRLSDEAASALGLDPGILLVPGGGDGQCAAVGCGVAEPGLCMINIGTGAGVQTYLSSPRRDPARVASLAAHVIADGWEMENHTQSSGAVFRWLRDEIGLSEKELADRTSRDAFDLLVERAMLAPPGSDGLVLIPTFNGSTGPHVELLARGVLLGLSLAHRREHIIRSFLEGITYEIRWMLEAMIEVGVPVHEIRLAGGGSRNPFWNRIHADILGRSVKTLELGEAAMVGAAMCAAVAIGEYRSLQEAAGAFVKIKETIEPRPENCAVYAGGYRIYRDTFDLLCRRGIFTELQGQAKLLHPGKSPDQ